MEVDLFFAVFYLILVLQRLIELAIAKKNENWMLQQGAVEFGKKHYRSIVLMHVLFFAFFLAEKIIENRGLSPAWPWLLLLFILLQILRGWAILSLGRYWNTKILVVPNADIVQKGPYRFIKHPNYLVVTLELLIIPLLFNSFVTALVLSFMNGIMLSIRIPEEEYALKRLTEYEVHFENHNRFLPKFLQKIDN